MKKNIKLNDKARHEAGQVDRNPRIVRWTSVPQEKIKTTLSRQITVLLAEDHTIMRQSLRALLNLDGQIKMIGEAGTGREVVEKARILRPDVILMDIAMPILNGLEATRQILADNPSGRVVILSALSDDEYLERTAHAGVVGFLEKHTSAAILSEAIREVAKGHLFFSPSIAKRMAAAKNRWRERYGSIPANCARLTSRESQVLQLVAGGLSNKQMAAELHISHKTVEKHRQNVMDKLNIHETAGLTRHAIATGVVESPGQLMTA